MERNPPQVPTRGPDLSVVPPTAEQANQFNPVPEVRIDSLPARSNGQADLQAWLVGEHQADILSPLSSPDSITSAFSISVHSPTPFASQTQSPHTPLSAGSAGLLTPAMAVVAPPTPSAVGGVAAAPASPIASHISTTPASSLHP